MSITQQDLAERLRGARSDSGLTQQEVADELGIPRTAVVHIEAGRRAVTSLELAEMSRLYGRGADEFLAEELSGDEVSAFFMTVPEVASNAVLRRDLQRSARLSRQTTFLEQVLGRNASRRSLPRYEVEPPPSWWAAICQGRDLAGQERSRLDLGSSPVWKIAEIIRRQGVRVTELPLPDQVSGIFFHAPDTGPVIVINESHPRTQRLFSYAHEYCHTLVDRSSPGTVSSVDNRDELREVRANAFASHFMMPETGVRSVLAGRGKLEGHRAGQEIYDGANGLRAQRRGSGHDQGIHVYDVVALARHFGISYEAALYHLMNLELLQDSDFEQLREQDEIAGKILRATRVAEWGEHTHWSLADQLLSLGLEAYMLGEISRKKLRELAHDAGVTRAEVEEIMLLNSTRRNSRRH